MATLVWDKAGERVYESGVSRGVLYGADGAGVVWNGIIQVQDGYDTKVEAVHFDGVKINDILVIGDFKGTLRAFTYPEIFWQYFGLLEDAEGFYVDGQPQERFGLSYRTEISSDTDQTAGYKIHLLYNLTATIGQTARSTRTIEPEATEFQWELTSIPEEIEGFKPTSHVILDSRKIDPYLLADIEGILYGTAEEDARLPSLKGMAAFMQKWGRLVITNHGDGTWTAYAPLPGFIEVDGDEFTITSDTITMLDSETYTIESTEVEGETP